MVIYGMVLLGMELVKFRAQLVHRGLKVQPALQGLQGRKVLPDPLAQRVPRDPQDHKDPLDP